jgi:hypothetical protein
MTPHFDYKIDDKLFYNRFDFVNYCLKQNNPTEIFNTGEFRYNGLPDHVDANNVIDPLTSTSKWMNGLRQNNKPVVLLFSGGLDGIFALDCMIRSNSPPDYLLVYVSDPFDDPDWWCGHTMETLYALKYLEEIIGANPVLKNTKIWRVNLGKKRAEDFYANDDWLKTSMSYSFSVESHFTSRSLPNISESDKQKYTFIHGGSFPKIKIIDSKPCFYMVDLALSSALDHKKIAYDFVLDNSEMFNYLCVQYHSFYKNNLQNLGKKGRGLDEMYECHDDFLDKRLLSDYSKFLATMPPQLDKRFGTLLPYMENRKIDNSVPYYRYLNSDQLKSWLIYLKAEVWKPNWFDNYKKTIIRNQDLIKSMLAFPGKITKMTKILD